MYSVSQEYKNKIKQNKGRKFKVNLQIEHSRGTLELTDNDLVQGTLLYTESSQAGEEFTVGSTVASDISFTILNKPEYEGINFIGATVFCNVGLLVKEGADAHFLQPSQPSKIPGFEETWEWVPLGRFNIDEAPRQKNTIQIKAIDNMINLDKPYSLSKLSYPANLYQIYVNICNVADIQVGTTSFPNQNYIVQHRPDDDLTLRDVLGYVAELAGCFAKCNRNGAIELKWYTPTDLTLSPDNRFDFKPSDDLIQIKGVMYSTEDTTYLAGSEDYAIDLTENPLVSGNYSELLNNIFNNVKETVFTPYTSNWQGNPALQAGDMLTQIDRDGKVYNTLVTKSVYKYRGRSTLEAKGLPEISRGYKGSTNRRIAQIKRTVEKDIGDKLTTLEQAQLNAMELMSNMLGGHLIVDKENGIFYIADNPDINVAKKIWKYGINGYAYYTDGLDSIPQTAVTADGSIVAMIIAANIITASMVQTGILQSEDGSTWLNLDDGSFNFKNALKWVNGQLRIQSPDIPEEQDLSGIEKDITDIKDLKPGMLQGGIVTIANDKIRVSHGSGQYTDVRADGVFRNWLYGEGSYLNDIYVVTNIASDNQNDSLYPIQINLPQRFRDRNVEVLLIPRNWRTGDVGRMNPSGSIITRMLKRLDMTLEIENLILNTSSPRVIVRAGLENQVYFADEGLDVYYKDLTFDVVVIGK